MPVFVVNALFGEIFHSRLIQRQSGSNFSCLFHFSYIADKNLKKQSLYNYNNDYL